ncbi:MAG: oligoendopeptidase F [Thermomicrobiales bacterium]
MVASNEILTRDAVDVQDTWDLSTIYASDADWDAAASSIPAAIAAAAAYRGRLGESAAVLRAAFDESMRAGLLLEALYVYARLRSDEETGNPAAQARLDRATALSIEAGEALAFFDPEILAIDEARLNALIDDPALAAYRRLLRDLQRRRTHTRSTEVEEILAQSADLARAPHDAFNVLDNADIAFDPVIDEHGVEVALTKGRYQLLVESKDRDVRRRAYETLMKPYAAHKHTLAALHSASVRKDVFYARVKNFGSARQAALFNHDIPESVYDRLIEATRAAGPTIERYLALRRRILDLDELAVYDLYVPLAPEPERSHDYREAVEFVLAGVAPLGPEYVATLRRGFAERWVDVRETKGKRSGAYSWGVYGKPPVMLMNWNGSLDHVFTLAHEAGHAMHSYLADQAQPYHDADYSIFTAEIASTLNEVLLTRFLLNDTPAGDQAGRFALLNRFADAINSTLVRQVMFAEFERESHATIEAGEPLTLETLNRLYGEAFDAYLPGVVNDDAAKATWSRVPHFYNPFYVFQYATGISAAIALAGNIRDEGEPAAERFLDLLRAGGSDHPLPLLAKAGVDLTTPAPVTAALKELETLVEEMERIVDGGAFGA